MSNLQLLKFINAYIDYSCFACYVMGMIVFRKNPHLRPLAYVLLLTFVSDQVVSYWGMYFGKIGVVYHFFNPLQLILLGWFFYKNFEEGIVKRMVPYALMFAVIWAIVNAFFFQGLKTNPTNFILIETFLLIVWSTILFIQRLDIPISQNIFKDPVFLAAMGVLCFNIFSFSYFLLDNYFRDHNIYAFTSIMKMLHLANFLYYGILVIAFIFSFNKLKSIAKVR